MKTKTNHKVINLLVVLLLLAANVGTNITPVFADATGVVAAAATASNTAPEIGTQITVTVNIDTSGVTSGGDGALGSYTGSLAWNPLVLSYDSYSGAPPAGFAGVVNVGNVGTGTIAFNGANATGATGNTVVLVVTFDVIGAGSAGLDLVFSAMAAATTFEDLLPIVQTTEATVTVPGEVTGVVELDGIVSSGTGAANESSVSFAHTTGTGDNRLMLVGVSWNAGTTANRSISSVVFTYDTTETLNFMEVKTEKNSANERFAAIYRSTTEPPNNKSGTLIVTFNGSVTNGIVAGAANFNGVEQTSPLGTPAGANGSSTAASVTLTELTGNELVFDTVFQGASAETQTLTAGAGQSQHWNAWISNTRAAASTEQAASSSVTMSWTATSSSVWAITAVPIRPALEAPPACYALTLTYSGLSGSAITPDLANSPGCNVGEYVEGQVIGLTAHPDWGYEVQSWTGTDNDSSTSLTNVLTMPAAAHEVSVIYESKPCYDLVLTSGDHGGDPTADPTFSQACTLGGTFVEGEVITLTAHPDTGYRVASWTGTDDDSSKALTNTLTMPSAQGAVYVTYEEIPPQVMLDGAVSSTTADDVSSVSFSHTTGSGDNRLMLVGASWNCGDTNRTISSITFTPDGGSALGLSEVITQLGYSTSSPRYSAIYSLLGPPSGEVGTVTITFSGSVSNGIMAGAANFSGVDQADPLGTPVGTNANSTSPSVELTGLNGDELVFDNVFLGAGSSSSTLTSGAGQTQLWNPAYVANLRAAASTEQAMGSSVTMSWTASTGNYWAIAAVPINPAISGATQQLTMAVTPEGGGTVTPTVGTYTYPQGTVVPISAVPATGYTFNYWEPDDTPGDPITNPYEASTTVTMDADYTVTAHFAPITHTLSVNTFGNGMVTKDPDIVGPYNYGTEVELTAVPDSSWLFDGWSGDLTGMVNPQTITMDADKTVTATFIQMQPEKVYLDGPVAYGIMESGSTLSIPTITGSGQNRLMLVGVSYNCSGSTAPRPNITSVTFTPDGGSALALDLVIDETSPPDQTEDPGRKAAIYALNPSLNPAASTAGVVQVTFSGSFTTGAIAGVAHFQGVDQIAPLGTPGGAGTAANADDTLSVTLPTSGKEMVFDTIWTGGQPSWTMWAVSPQIELWNDGFQNTMGGASIRDAETGTTTMTWNRSNAGYMALVAVPINPYVEQTLGTIIIEKQTIPDGHSQMFEFTGAAAGTIGDGGQIVVNDLVAGTYQVQEVVQLGWALTSIVCDDVNSTPDLPNNRVTITLEAGETVTCVFTNSLLLDFGDAPDTYKTLLASDGARHFVDGPVLGSLVDDEWDGLPTALADGDDNDWSPDEDGVSFPTAAPLTIGGNAQVGVVLSQPGGNLDAWIDFNGNGFFDHPSEHLWSGESQDFSSPPFPSPTTYFLDFSVPASAVEGISYARFRLSTAGGLLPYGIAADGEVEDYRIEIVAPTSHTVTFNANGGSGTMAPQTASAPTALTTNTFTRTGYTFRGWHTEASGGITYVDGDTYDFSADITLYAVWEGNNYWVTLDGNGGETPAESPIEVTFGLPYGISVTTTRTGYTFAGWFTAASGGTEVTAATVVATASDHTLYAHWTANTYTVTFDANGGITPTPASKIVTFDSAYGTLATTTRTGYTFAGWFTATSGGTEVTAATIVATASDHTLYAHWSDLPTLTVTADAGQTKVYGAADPLSFTYTYLPNDPPITFTGALSRVAGEDVGSYAITQGDLAATGYTIIFNSADFTITPKDASVTPDPASKTYGDTDPALTGTLNGFLAGDGVAAAYSRTVGETVAGSPYLISATLSPVGVLTNYDITYNTANFTITPKAASVTPNAASKTYGDAEPTLTGVLTGFLPADAVTAVYSRAAGETVAGSPYTISAVLSPAGVLGNYDITYNTANFTINVRPITVTADNTGKYVGQVDPPLTYTITAGSLAFSDSFTGALARISGEFVGTYAITRGNLALNANYNMTFVEGTFTISAIPTVTVTVDSDQTKVYGQSDPVFTYQSSDPEVDFTGALSREPGNNVGSYAITQGTLAADGYVITFVSADFTITAKPVAVTADARTKVYGDADPDLTYQYTPDLVSGDSFSGALERAAGENVGTHAINQGDLALSSNYTIAFTGANLTITTRPITVKADDQSKNHGEIDPALTYTITSGSLAFADAFTGALARVAGEDIGEYAILQGSLALNANYNLSFVEGTFTIIAGSEHQVTLKTGWNLVSFNLIPSDPDIEVILADVMDDVDLVYAWNGQTASWMRYDPAVGFGNTLAELDETMGFWINMEADATLTVVGIEPTSTEISLFTGWNLIGYPSELGDDLPEAVSSVASKYDLIMAYKAADTADPWKLFDPSAPSWVNDLDQMDPGWGYWIDMTEAGTLSVDFD